MNDKGLTESPSWMRFLSRIFAGWQFPTYVVTLLIGLSTFLLAVLFVPASETGLGAFAQELKIWCFGYDPATQTYDWVYVIVMIINPLMLSGIVAGLWAPKLLEGWELERRGMGTVGTLALLTVAALGSGLLILTPEPGQARELPFPAEELRTELEPPALELTNQNHERIALEEMRGRVVLLTAVYANCHTACPQIITRMKRAISELSPAQKEDLTVIAVTLDPENDTPKRLAMTAETHDLDAPLFNLVTGDPEEVNDILDELNVSRRVNPETGVIEHSNLFALVDRSGVIAYRLTLGDRHARWLPTALKNLLNETDSRLSTRR